MQVDARTYHADVVAVEQRLGKVRRLPALLRVLAGKVIKVEGELRAGSRCIRTVPSRLPGPCLASQVGAFAFDDEIVKTDSLTKSSKPRSLPVNSRSLFMITQIRDPIHLSISSGKHPSFTHNTRSQQANLPRGRI